MLVTSTPLLPRHGIYLQTDTPTDTDRFAEQFRVAWRMIPLHARRRILAYWKQWIQRMAQIVPPEAQALASKMSIAIAVQDDWHCRTGHRHWETDEPGAAIATCSTNGYGLHFWRPAVEAMPDEVLCVLIVHELAHVHSYACGETPHEECDREKVLMWDVDQYLLDEWLNTDGWHRAREAFYAEHPAECREA